MDLDRMDVDTTTAAGSQRSTLSPRSSQKTMSQGGSQQDFGGVVIPQSASSFMGGPAGGFGGLSAGGSVQGGMPDVGLFDDDLGLLVGEDGALFDDMPVRQTTAVPSRGTRTDVSGVSSKARREGDEALQGQDQVFHILCMSWNCPMLMVRSSDCRTRMALCLFRMITCSALMRSLSHSPAMKTCSSNKRLQKKLQLLLCVVGHAQCRRPYRSIRPWSSATATLRAGTPII